MDILLKVRNYVIYTFEMILMIIYSIKPNMLFSKHSMGSTSDSRNMCAALTDPCDGRTIWL